MTNFWQAPYKITANYWQIVQELVRSWSEVDNTLIKIQSKMRQKNALYWRSKYPDGFLTDIIPISVQLLSTFWPNLDN